MTTLRALEHYKAAIELDKDYALAWSGIADANSAAPVNGDAEPLFSRRLAREAVNEAVRAGAGLAEVQTSQGLLNVWLEWNWPLAEQKFRQAIGSTPAMRSHTGAGERPLAFRPARRRH